MSVKKTVLMGSAFSFLIGIACMGMTTGIAGCGGGCSQGMSGCPFLGSSGQTASTPSQSVINQCTEQHTVPCQSQTTCQWTCNTNPNMPANGPCSANQ
ncbi:MAG TPA: hypothetical protein VNK24_01215 [Elusimicrobiota bacterium]|nr:hypothetical protein [Elusimicrobiota bacterium]